MKELFVPQAVWDGIWENISFAVAAPEDPVRVWIEAHCRGRRGSCLELGCFPGRYLAVFGELGYELHGVDLTPRLETHCKPWLLSRGYKVGNLVRADVFSYSPPQLYDVVCSFGLIEHFGEWSKLLEIHARLVAEGGYLLIATPNFRGWVQQLLHRCFDSENLSLHNLAAMVPRRWAEVIRPLGFEILECGHFGSFDFWVGTQPRPLLAGLAARAACKAHRWLKPVTSRLPRGVGAYSPYCGLVARRVSRPPASAKGQ